MRKYLFIINGHSSHINWKFIEKCDILYILVFILPPHSMHYLQPLDISLFSSLTTAYINKLNKLMFNNLNIINISKQTF